MDAMKQSRIAPEKLKTNRKLGLTLGFIALVFFLGVMVRMSLFGA